MGSILVESSVGDGADSLNSELTRKAKLEADLLAEQLKPKNRRAEALKIAAGASGLILALISLFGGLLSVVGWFINQNENRELRIEERLDRALSQLSADKPAQRVAAVSSLKSFLDPRTENRNTRVVVSLANAIALESDRIVRNSMISFFSDLDSSVVGLKSQTEALATLVKNNRGLVRDKKLWIEPPGNWYRFASEDDQGQRLEALMLSTSALFRHGSRVKDMSGLYLVLANLSGLDLSETNFNDSLLNWSDFSDSTLRRATFDGANLDSTYFTAADLQDAKLTFTESHRLGPRRFSFIELSLANEKYVSMPDFNCADLRRADFSGFPLWDLTSDAVSKRQKTHVWLNFHGANLQGANFERVGVFFLEDDVKNRLFMFRSSAGRKKSDDPFTTVISALDHDSILSGSPLEFSNAISQFHDAFMDSNLAEAHFPTAMKQFLGQQPTHLPKISSDCKPRAAW